jgi:hypothetical protein
MMMTGIENRIALSFLSYETPVEWRGAEGQEINVAFILLCGLRYELSH